MDGERMRKEISKAGGKYKERQRAQGAGLQIKNSRLNKHAFQYYACEVRHTC